MIAPLLLKGLLAGLALSQTVPAEPLNDLSLGVSTIEYVAFFRPSPTFVTLEAAYQRPLASEGLGRAVRVGVGLRTTATHDAYVPLEGFARIRLTGRFGVWEPSVGPELGVSGFSRLTTRLLFPPTSDLFHQEDLRAGPLYLAFGASPLEFHFGRFSVSAMEIQFGTVLSAPSTVMRYQVLLAKVGVSL
jgi:hypothetical protein